MGTNHGCSPNHIPSVVEWVWGQPTGLPLWAYKVSPPGDQLRVRASHPQRCPRPWGVANKWARANRPAPPPPPQPPSPACLSIASPLGQEEGLPLLILILGQEQWERGCPEGAGGPGSNPTSLLSPGTATGGGAGGGVGVCDRA